MDSDEAPAYLAPYARAVELHGAGFGALLIADPSWQEARFAVFAGIMEGQLGGLGGRTLADLGSGRADLLAWLLERGIACGRYLGVEAMAELDRFARARAERDGWIGRPGLEVELLHADFVADPSLCATLVAGPRAGPRAGPPVGPPLGHGADVLWFCGSLNTLDEAEAMAVLEQAWAALEHTPGGVLAFNFLSGPAVSDPPNSGWPRPSTGLPRRDTQAWFAWACARTPLVIFAQHYLGAHDATLVLVRPS